MCSALLFMPLPWVNLGSLQQLRWSTLCLCGKYLLERAQFDFFNTESQESRELSVCVWQMSFSALFLLNEIMVPKFINNSHLKQNP